MALTGKPRGDRKAFARSAVVCWAGLGVLVCGAIALLVGGWFSGREVVPLPLPEVSRTNLVRLDGRWCQFCQTNPFTGWMVEHYPSGSLLSRSLVSNGLLNGVSEGWQTNGQLQICEYFKDSVSHGLRTKWHPNGAKMTESMIADGKHQGTFRRWHENGALAEEIEMHDGQPDGQSRAFYPSGFLKSQATLRLGEVMERKSWEDGEIKP